MGRRFGRRRIGIATPWRRLFWPAFTTLLMLLLTLSLGVWQLHRLEWKQGLLAEIDAAEASAPAALGPAPAAFARVTIEGRFLPLVARYGAEVRAVGGDAKMGAHILTPIKPAGGEPIIVDRGWAPLDFDATPPPGVIALSGYVRPPEKPVRFGASDDPAARRFYALDPAAIGASLGLAQVAPFTLVVLGRSGQLPEPATSLPRPPNDHLAYALTWFGLSLALVTVFAIYARRTTRTGAVG